MTGQYDERQTYEENFNFIRESVERLEAGEVSIDELESLSGEMAKSFAACRERLARTRRAISETMAPPQQPES